MNELAGTESKSNRAVPYRLALIYLLTGVVWMLVTDLLLSQLIADPELRNEYRIVKDWAFVFLGAFILYWLLRRATDALLRSEERYRLLIEHLPDSVFIYSNDKVTYSNPMGVRLLHLQSAEEIVGKSWPDILSSDDDKLQNPLSTAQTPPGVSTFNETTITLTDGTVVPIELVVIPFNHGHERVSQIVVHDISRRKQSQEALHRSEAAFRELFEHNPLPILVFDRHTRRITATNKAMAQHYGYSQESLLSKSLDSLSIEQDIPRIQALLASGSALSRSGYSTRHRKNDGAIIDVDVALRVLPSSSGDTWLALINDVTESQKAQAEQVALYQTLEHRIEERTHEIEQKRRIAEGLRDIVSVLNSSKTLENILDFVANQASEMLGNNADAVYQLLDDAGTLQLQTSRGLEQVFNQSIPMGFGTLGAAVATHKPVAINNLALAAVDTTQPLEARTDLQQVAACFQAVLSLPIIIRDKVYGGINLYYVQAQEFSDEEISLAQSFSNHIALAIENSQLQTQVVEQAAVAERNRLAHDLHDAVSQSLFAASLIAEVLPVIWQRDQEEGQKRLLELHELTKGALAEMRTILLTLRPSALAEMALKDAIQQLIDVGISRMRLPIHASLADTGKLPVDVKTTFYRITQEALNNVFKHAKATDIVVTLEDAQDQIRLAIQDNGCGFDTAIKAPGHMGLEIMAERAAAVDMDLQIESEPGHGARLITLWHKAGVEREA
ncbi:MAG: PAS domain S-box protein [Anaerolineaceae bacterium]|nr:PAS domain S-box protein [Anaerolineaceae bacterium]